MIKLGNIDEFKSLISEGRGLARSNLYFVKFPTIAGIVGYDLGLLCNNIDLPTRQLTTVDRQIGITNQKVVYGYANPSISATFRVFVFSLTSKKSDPSRTPPTISLAETLP